MKQQTIKIIKPQDGYQMKFCSSSADTIIGGGAAGVGKTFSLLLDLLRFIHIAYFNATIFRRTSPQIRQAGGLWDTSEQLYYGIPGMRAINGITKWVMPNKASVKFRHLQYEKDLISLQGAQIPYIGFDELTHFTEKMFFYLTSRNRFAHPQMKTCIRTTCNPDPESWVAGFISWFIDQESGFPIPERDGVLRYYTRENDVFISGSTKDEVIEKLGLDWVREIEADGDNPHDMIKSMTFISGKLDDNQELLSKDKNYKGTLRALPKADRDALLMGNWKYRPNDDELFDFDAFRDIFTNAGIQRDNQKRYITADIAGKGSDLMVIWVWCGWRIVDVEVFPYTTGEDVIIELKKAAQKHNVQQRNIVFDADGGGWFIDGFLKTAKEFHNGGTPINGENYANLKTQCFFKLAKHINEGESIYIEPQIASKTIKIKGQQKTVENILLDERRAIKQAKKDHDGKLRIIPKEQMKTIINRSPDFIEGIMMRILPELKRDSLGYLKFKK